MTQLCFDRFTSLTERTIANKVIDALLEDYVVRVHDGEEFNTEHDLTTADEVREQLATTGEDRLFFRVKGDDRWLGWIWLIWGNGEDLISDYTANGPTDAIVEPIYEELGI